MCCLQHRPVLSSVLALTIVSVLMLLDAPRLHAQHDLSEAKTDPFLASLNGQILTGSGQVAANARIELRGLTGNTISAATVDSSGSFRFENVVPGVYEVVAIYGINQAATTVNISGANPELTISIDAKGAYKPGNNTVAASELRVPSKARKSFEQAEHLVDKKDLQGALTQLNNALAVWPQYAKALTLRGVLRMAANQNAEAREDFRMALSLDHGYGLAYVGLAADYNLMGQFDEALKIIEQSSAFTLQMWQSHFEASKALLGKKSLIRALDEANRASALRGQDMPALILIKAQLYLDLKQRDHAIGELRKFLAQKSKGPDADRIRQVLARLGK